MRYICLGYYDEKRWETISERERNALMDECFAYDDALRKNGHFVGGEALQSVRNAVTLRPTNGKLSITDGPYAETKEQLGGILVLEARDLNHAIQLMSNHDGPFMHWLRHHDRYEDSRNGSTSCCSAGKEQA